MHGGGAALTFHIVTHLALLDPVDLDHEIGPNVLLVELQRVIVTEN